MRLKPIPNGKNIRIALFIHKVKEYKDNTQYAQDDTGQLVPGEERVID